MIKSRIHLKIWEGERCKFAKVLEKFQKYSFFIFWDILNKKKDNLGQECVKEGLLCFQGKTVTIAPDFPRKCFFFQF